MTYRSETLAFKKSELLEVLQAINSNFSFEDTGSHQRDNATNSKHENIIEQTEPTPKVENTSAQQENQLPLFLKMLVMSEYFTVVEAACCISHDEPAKIQALIDSSDLNYNAWSYGEHIQAVKVIESGIKAKKLDIEDDGLIPRASLQQFLFERHHVITGFNDKLPEQESIECGRPFVHQISLNTEDNLYSEITRLRKVLIDKTKAIKDLQEHIKQLETEQSEIQTSEQESKLHTRTENNVSKLILVLAEMAGINVSTPYANYQAISTQADLLGIDKFPSDENVAGWLKKASLFKNPN